MIAKNVSESLLHKVCCRMASCDLMSSYGIYLKTDFVALLDAHREACILRIQDVEIDAVFLNDLDYAEFVISMLYYTCIEDLSAACSVERCGFENDELAVLVAALLISDENG